MKFEWPNKEESEDKQEMVVRERTCLKPNEVCYINGEHIINCVICVGDLGGYRFLQTVLGNRIVQYQCYQFSNYAEKQAST